MSLSVWYGCAQVLPVVPYGALLCDLYGFSFRIGTGKSLATADSARLSCRMGAQATSVIPKHRLLLLIRESKVHIKQTWIFHSRGLLLGTTSNMESLDIVKACVGDDHNDACKGFKPLQRLNLSESEKEELVVNLLGAEVSLSDLICDASGRKGGVSLFEALLKLPNGHLTVKAVLDSLMKQKHMDEGVEITLSSGLLYNVGKDHSETKILEDLLKIRRQSQGKGSVAKAAVDGVLTHPVIEAFIRQKWHSARFLYFGHIRYSLSTKVSTAEITNLPQGCGFSSLLPSPAICGSRSMPS